MKKKQLLIILCVTMVIWIVLLGVAIGTHRPGESTKQDDNPSVTTVSTDPSVTTGEELDENGYKKDDLPETLNFGGEKIGILYWNDITQQEFEAESMTGELINDAIYERNLATEQRLGIKLGFTGIPSFAPELFRAARSKDPFKAKQLQKGLQELGEEGAIQVFTGEFGNILLGAVGQLQFEIVAQRLATEYKVDAIYESTDVSTARWLSFPDEQTRKDFCKEQDARLATDVNGNTVYLATSIYNLETTMKHWPQVVFHTTREMQQTFD